MSFVQPSSLPDAGRVLKEFLPRTEDPFHTQERLQGLLSAVMSLAENLSLEAVLDRVVTSACQLVGAHYGALGVIGPGDVLTHFVTVGMEEDQARLVGDIPKGRGVLGHLIRDPQRIRLSDLTEHPQASGFPEHHPEMRTFLGVPVRVRGVAFGNLYLTEKEGGEDFTAEDEELAVALAAAAGVAIENARLFEDATRRQQWLEAGMDVSERLMGNPTAEAAGLDLIADGALQQSESVVSMIAFPDPGGRVLRCGTAVGASHLVKGHAIAVDSAPIAHLLSTGESVLCQASELWDGPPPAAELGPVLVAALGHKGTHAGILILARPTGAPGYGQVDVEMNEVYCSRAALALELAHAHLMREQQIVFSDRDRIARDLHDLVIQRIFAAGLSVQSLRRHTTDPVAQQRINSITGELDETIRGLRDTIYALGDDGGRERLSSRIVRAVQDGTWQAGTTPELQMRGPVDGIPEPVAGHLLAVLSEGLSNALRHSGARSITITVSVRARQVKLLIEDDGKGFSIPERTSGLSNMHHRALAVGGTFAPVSAPGHGTRLSWTAPLPK
ncbi:GAF domain-containing sensor histidine kinase [Arthrobacter sp. TMN-37]